MSQIRAAVFTVSMCGSREMLFTLLWIFYGDEALKVLEVKQWLEAPFRAFPASLEWTLEQSSSWPSCSEGGCGLRWGEMGGLWDGQSRPSSGPLLVRSLCEQMERKGINVTQNNGKRCDMNKHLFDICWCPFPSSQMGTDGFLPFIISVNGHISFALAFLF